MRIDVFTLFPATVDAFCSESLLGKARASGVLDLRLHDPRDHTSDVHRTVDDSPFGGGPGMVLMCEPVFAAVEDVQQKAAEPGLLVMLTPAGERLTQPVVKELATHKRLLLLCGRYEGFDERIRLGLKPREISIGDFICNGGEVPAMVVIDTVVRYVPGVLGEPESLTEESHNEPGRLEYPQYTRPRVFRGMEVPEILMSGNHQAVARWRREQSEIRSRRRQAQEHNPIETEGMSHEEPIRDPGGEQQSQTGASEV